MLMSGNYEDSYLPNADFSLEFESLVNKNIKNKTKTEESQKKGKWTKEEDEKLTQLVSIFGGKNWKKISENILGRSSIQCLHRWTKILQPGLVKGPWTIEEDRKLLEWISKEGPTRWSLCSEFIKGRNGKQCRERWFNTLNPQVKKGNWSPEEDYKIFTLFQKFGGKWARITLYFDGRTENSVKNRFYSTLRKLYTEKKKECYPFGNINNIPTMSTSLDDLLKYFNLAYSNIKFKFMKIKNMTPEQLVDYDNSILQNKSESQSVSRAPEIKIIEKPNTINVNVNINSNNTNNYNIPNFSLNSLVDNNYDNQNNYKNMDIFSLENQIIDMCDNSSLIFTDNYYGYENQIDNMIENLFEKNNIVVNDEDCNICCDNFVKIEKNQEKPTGNRKEMLNSLFMQLNDIEQAVQMTKKELMKMEGTKLESQYNYTGMIDTLFKF